MNENPTKIPGRFLIQFEQQRVSTEALSPQTRRKTTLCLFFLICKPISTSNKISVS